MSLRFFLFFWFSLRVPVSVYLGFQSRVSFLGLNLGVHLGCEFRVSGKVSVKVSLIFFKALFRVCLGGI